MELEDVDEAVLFGDVDDEIVPSSLFTTAAAMDIAFHPTLPLLAVGLVNGEVELYEQQGKEMVKKFLENDFSSWLFSRKSQKTEKKLYSDGEVVVSYNHGNLQMHPFGGVRGLEFTDDGAYLVSCSGDKTISVLDCVTSRLVIHLSSDTVSSKTTDKKKKINDRNKKNSNGDKVIKLRSGATAKAKGKEYLVTPNPHQMGISALNICDENLIATGDDDGLIAVWDMRSRQPAFVYHEHGDYVSQLLYFTDANELVSSSGDTCLGVYDVKAGKVREFSEKRNDELSCFTFVNSSAASSTFIPTIFCGTPSGSLPLWKYGSWRRPYDCMEGHPRECEALVSFNDEYNTFNHNIVLTGSCDGIVRVMQMYPLRRQLCSLSARDVQQSAGSGFHTTHGSHQKRDHMVVRRERGHEAIRRMRINHENSLLAVSGTDSIIDFVDVRFLQDEKALDELRYKREQRHLKTIREMEAERDAKAALEDQMEEEEGREEPSSEGEADSNFSDSDSDESEEATSSEDEDSEDEDAVPLKRAKGERPTSVPSVVKKAKKSTKKSTKPSKSEKVEEGTANGTDWMEEYKLDRQKKRERAAATQWIKEEKKKKVNFKYEKRRRRVGGFFGDLSADN